MGLDSGDELHEEHFIWRKSPFREATLEGGPPPTSNKLCSKFAPPQNPGGQIKEGTSSSQRICTNHRWTTPKTEKVHCLPHHALIRKDTKTTKVRIAYDASSKETFGTSSNDCLHVGPPPNPSPVTHYPLHCDFERAPLDMSKIGVTDFVLFSAWMHPVSTQCNTVASH